MPSTPRHTLHDGSRSGLLDAQMMPPPRNIRSAPSSNMASPNVSPPHHYIPYSTGHALPSFNYRSSSGTLSPIGPPRPGENVNLLATAASQVERDSLPHLSRLPPLSNSYAPPRLPANSLAQYSISAHPMSRSHSHETDDPYRHRATKKSRPNSPFSTAPPSPTFSHDSLSPTPDHTPIVTPAHSPRLRPLWVSENHQLPHIRNLSLHQGPVLPPMEPSTDQPSNSRPSASKAPLRISDMLSRPDLSDRKLPLPRLAVTDAWGSPATTLGARGPAGSSMNGDGGERV